jgi:hypothetical protein
LPPSSVSNSQQESSYLLCSTSNRNVADLVPDCLHGGVEAQFHTAAIYVLGSKEPLAKRNGPDAVVPTENRNSVVQCVANHYGD